MDADRKVTQNERMYLRDLAKRYLELAALPIMAERTGLWYAHNSSRPIGRWWFSSPAGRRAR